MESSYAFDNNQRAGAWLVEQINVLVEVLHCLNSSFVLVPAFPQEMSSFLGATLHDSHMSCDAPWSGWVLHVFIMCMYTPFISRDADDLHMPYSELHKNRPRQWKPSYALYHKRERKYVVAFQSFDGWTKRQREVDTVFNSGLWLNISNGFKFTNAEPLSQTVASH